MIYLDNAATTQIAPAVLEAMLPYLKCSFGNAGSLYKLGRDSASAVANAREQVANLIGAKPEQIVFTSGGSEANSFVFYGLRKHLLESGRKTIVVSAVEHDSVLKSAIALCSESDIKDEFDIKFLGVNRYGEADIEQLEQIISPDVALVSVMYVNNETGAVNDIKKIGELCKRNGVLFHTDCVQAAGCQTIDVEEIGCDFASISSHKIHGPKGVGALFVRDKTIVSPIIYGGSAQEFGIRGGTENVAGIVGFGKACSMCSDECIKTTSAYRKFFISTIRNYISQDNINKFHINGREQQDGRILNIRFDGIDGETLVLYLDTEGIAISAGSACCSHESAPSHVLTAMGLSSDEARDSVRISFSDFNTLDEVETAAKVICDYVAETTALMNEIVSLRSNNVIDNTEKIKYSKVE